MYDPRIPQFQAFKRIVRYVEGTMSFGLHLYHSNSTQHFTYTDSHWGGCLDNHRSTFGYCCFLGKNLISLPFKLQLTLSRSRDEAEYRGGANVVENSCWLATKFIA